MSQDREKRRPAPETEPAGISSRRAALDILFLIREGASLEDALNECRTFNELEGSDRGFARALATAVLRRRGSLDHIIGAYLDRPLPRNAWRVMDTLRLTAAQILLLETPPHAAVSTGVALAKDRRETAGYAGLINAISRKVTKTGPATLQKLPARTDTPAWLWRGWERAYGPKLARAIAEAHQIEAPIDLTIKDSSRIDNWAEHLGGKVVANGSVRLKNAGAVPKLGGFEEGEWWVQDAAAALPVALLGDIGGKRVIDLCAAPGGKTLQLAARGARVTAIDKSSMRLARLHENLERTNLSASPVVGDALLWQPSEPSDAVLVDAPCSATGTIRRHPDIPWTKTETDIEALEDLQRKIIDRAILMVKPGGLLVYCVCSLQPEEGEKQAAAALKRHANLKRVPVTADEIGGIKGAITRDGDLRTLPSMIPGGMDGFFAARFEVNGQ